MEKPSFARDPASARREQEELAARVRLRPLKRRVRRIAGCDCAYDEERGLVFAAVVSLAWPELETEEERVAVRPIEFPYVPGLLSFREGPSLLEALRALSRPPDLVFVDGQGIAHPLRIGIAAHLGVLLGLPTIGAAKSRLIGTADEPGTERGCRSPLLDGDERIGTLLRTRDGVKPLYVSPGHLCGFADAENWVLDCCRGFRLPEPTRRADALSRKAKR